MKRSVFLTIAVLTVFYATQAIAEPVAPLATLTDVGKQIMEAEGTTEADMKKDVPPKELVGIPAYPGSLFVMAEGDENELSMVQFISKDSPEKVIAWYKKQLSKEWQYMPGLATKRLNDVEIFVKTNKKNISAIDSLNYQQLEIAKVEKPGDIGAIEMVFDVSGIKSWIIMTLKPMMQQTGNEELL